MKIIVVVRDVLLREDKVRELFKGFHRCESCSPLPLASLPCITLRYNSGYPVVAAGLAALRVYRLYVDAVSNSFTPLDGTLTSPTFELQVYRLVEASLPQLEYKGPSVLG